MPLWLITYLVIGVLAAVALFWAVRRDSTTTGVAWYIFLGLAGWPLVAVMFIIAWAFCIYPHKDAFDTE